MDHVDRKAQELSRMLDSGNQSGQVADALRRDSFDMNPRDFDSLVNTIRRMERKDRGDNLVVAQNGDLIIDTGRQGYVVATRDFEMNHARDRQARGTRGQNQRNDVLVDGVVHGGIGAVTGAIINGKKGAIAGGVGGVGNVIVDEVGGKDTRDPVTDTVVKGAIGAGIGAIIDGKKGAAAGAAGSIVPNIADRVLRKRQ